MANNNKLSLHRLFFRKAFKAALLPLAVVEIALLILIFQPVSVSELYAGRIGYVAAGVIFHILFFRYLIRISRGMSDRIGAVLADMSRAGSRVATGECDAVQLNRCNIGELDNLSENFESMAQDLKRRHHYLNEQLDQANKAKKVSLYMEKELHKYREYLEELVKERTDELLKTNEDLKQEIEDRKLADTELRKTKQYLDNVINSMPSVVIGIDTGGNITEWNLFAEKETGIPPDQAIGESLSDVFSGYSKYEDEIRRSVTEGKPVRKEKILQYVNGNMRYKDIMIYPLISDGIIGAVLRIDDVTEKARIEEMMIHTEKMMSVGGLAAGMAHEINNPLGVILQAVQNAIRRVSPEIEANVRAAEACGTDLDKICMYLDDRGIFRYLNGIREAGDRASEIVSEMIHFSQRSESSHKLTHINKLLDDTIELGASDYELKKTYNFACFDIVREYEPDLPQIRCSMTEIEHVVLNLIRNAAQALAEIREREERPKIVFRTMREDDYMRIEVEDNGPGMNEDIRKRIFEPFYTTKGVGVGTGLGLSVSYFIITNNHKGTIIAESEVGNGTRFVIRLPLG
ncbi:ATP-binding protein [Desulfobacterales bacterium HSG2]|nr:ATP-binding protein [Desulfobacterales bacterium HSG2]